VTLSFDGSATLLAKREGATYVLWLVLARVRSGCTRLTRIPRSTISSKFLEAANVLDAQVLRALRQEMEQNGLYYIETTGEVASRLGFGQAS